MSIKVPQYNIEYLSDTDKTKSIDIYQQCLSTIQAEITSNFLYEPVNNETIDRIKSYAEYTVRRFYGNAAVCGVEIDNMRDLELKDLECRACAEASSYEEYRIKRAAMNLPDAAGSEREWSRMSKYKPGAVEIHIDFIPPQTVQEINCNFEMS